MLRSHEEKNRLGYRICIITAQFGKLPCYINLWLKSCRWNPGIDFLVCSDIKVDEFPENVRWLYMGFSEFRTLAEEKLGMKVQLDTPYECCDLKTVYGVIFSEYLNGYDYWGYCDVDMVFGDLEWYFKKYDLNLYDKFLSFGHLTLIRNTKENNERYRLPCNAGRSYRDAFTSKGSMHFDEGEINQIYKMYGFPIFDQRIAADISPVFKRMRLGGDGINHCFQAFFWQNGKVWRAYQAKTKTWKGVVTEEFAYIHFQKRRMAIPGFDIDETNRFYICSDHFEVKEEIGYPTITKLKAVNPNPGRIVEGFELLRYRLAAYYRRITRILKGNIN